MADEDFASGTSGQIFGIRATSRALASDAVADVYTTALARPWRLRAAAQAWPTRQILALAIERTGEPNVLGHARAELLRSKHRVQFASKDVGTLGKFQNLNRLLEVHPLDGCDWLLVLDDDVLLPRGFLDAFVFLAERFELRLAQPAHRSRSHAAWSVTRRRARSVVRETRFVETGPVVAFHRDTFDVLLPFPELRFGWGLDLHWSALARERGWRLGVIDALAIEHRLRRIAASYHHADALAETRRFLAARPYTRAADAQQTLATHTSWR
jgi:hypothetical protein